MFLMVVFSWIVCYKSILFLITGYGHPKCFVLGETRLCGLALNWWTNLRTRCINQDLSRVIDWTTISQHMKAKLLPKNDQSDLARHLLSLTQEAISAVSLLLRFHLLAAHACLQESVAHNLGCTLTASYSF